MASRALRYVGLAVVCLILGFGWALLIMLTEEWHSLLALWQTPTLQTTFLVVAVLNLNRRSWSRRLFWVTLFGALLVHVGVVVAIVTSVGRVRTFWWFAAVVPEMLLLDAIFFRLGLPAPFFNSTRRPR